MVPDRHLDVCTVDDDVIAVVSALCEPPHPVPYRSLRERTIERIAGLHRATRTTQPASGAPLFQLVVATTSAGDLNAFTLAGVSLHWWPTVERADAPPLDVVQMAVALWQPTVPGSRFASFTAAYDTADRLTAAAWHADR